MTPVLDADSRAPFVARHQFAVMVGKAATQVAEASGVRASHGGPAVRTRTRNRVSTPPLPAQPPRARCAPRAQRGTAAPGGRSADRSPTLPAGSPAHRTRHATVPGRRDPPGATGPPSPGLPGPPPRPGREDIGDGPAGYLSGGQRHRGHQLTADRGLLRVQPQMTLMELLPARLPLILSLPRRGGLVRVRLAHPH